MLFTQSDQPCGNGDDSGTVALAKLSGKKVDGRSPRREQDAKKCVS